MGTYEKNKRTPSINRLIRKIKRAQK